MSCPAEIDYMRRQIKNHLALFFEPKVSGLFNNDAVQFLPLGKALEVRGNVVVIPIDITNSGGIDLPYKVDFNDTKLTLWNRNDKPQTDFWKALPDETTPVWYQHKSGTVIPAWNIYQNLLELLTFAEERAITRRDNHGRFVAAYSPRHDKSLLGVPAFNEAVAVLAAALVGLNENGRPKFNLNGLIKPPVIVLSHDCDVLYGSDLWSQSIRAFRIFQPLLKLRLPKISNLWWIMRNAVTPRRYYFDNVQGMVELERLFGYRSTFYVLNGTGGRYGARNGSAPLAKLFKAIPQSWDIGIHYNYDTFLDEPHFQAQLAELQNMCKNRITAGRAHYLRFDSQDAFPFWQKFGIKVDESSGFSDSIGYRNGIAGCFQVFDAVNKKPLNIWEVPMTIMDQSIVRLYGKDAIKKFSDMMRHLSKIGGAISLLFHPGVFFNPEIPEMRGIYHQMLVECRQIGAVSKTAGNLVDESERTP